MPSKKLITIGEDHQVSLPFTKENTDSSGLVNFVASVRLEYPEDMVVPDELVMTLGISSPGVASGEDIHMINQDEHQDLRALAEGMSDLLLGGEHGWEECGAHELLKLFRENFRKTKSN
jgi:hypothetical protein